MPNKHKNNPVTFRPPEGDRVWLYARAKEAGRSVGSLLTEALSKLRAEHSEEEPDPKENDR